MFQKKFLQHIGHELHTHLPHYLLLATAAIFYLILLSNFRGNRSGQFAVSTIFIVFYGLWGVVHHISEGTLTFKTVLEYILIGSVVLILVEIFLVG